MRLATSSSLLLLLPQLQPLVILSLEHPRRLPTWELPWPGLPRSGVHRHVVPDALVGRLEWVFGLLQQALLYAAAKNGAAHAVLRPGGVNPVEHTLHADLVNGEASVIQLILDLGHDLILAAGLLVTKLKAHRVADDVPQLLLVLVLHEEVVGAVAKVPSVSISIGPPRRIIEVHLVAAHGAPPRHKASWLLWHCCAVTACQLGRCDQHRSR
mmetsp:Transcript_22206/g.51880  ORF Transcript_22206/g.51880 Transcript_22206/m.51880 type:complete len:212 (+) Transcript_22206:67-702(+)